MRTAKTISLILNFTTVCALVVSLSVLNREGVELPWTAITALIQLLGYAHVVWIYRPRFWWALLGAILYWITTSVIVLVVGTALIIGMYGQ